MSKRLVKCYGGCGKKYPQDQMKKLNLNPNSTNPGRNHCPACYERKVKEHQDRRELYLYIQETYGITFPTGQMLRQIKVFHEEHGYTYRNIRFTLDYIFTIKRTHKPITKFGVSLVPYFYDEMIAYYKDLKHRRENTVVKEVKPVQVKLKPFEKNDDYRSKKMIKMEDLI